MGPNRNGRWNSPSQNVDFFLSSSPVASCCQEVSHLNCWKHQADEDITTAIEKLEKQKSLFSSFARVPHSQSVSLPASAWSSPALGSSPCSPSSSNTPYWMQNIPSSYGSNYPGKFSFGKSSSQMSSSNGLGGSSSVMSHGSKMSMTPSNSSSRSSSCFQDRLYQMD